MNNLIKTFLIAFVLLFSHLAYASVVSIDASKNEFPVGGLSNLNIKLDTQSSLINTIEGDLVYDKSFFKIEQINTGNSFISFWIEKPSIDGTGVVHFSGLVPGGITINNGNLFSVVLRGAKEGKSDIRLENVSLFLNDGEGSKDQTKVKNMQLSINGNLNGLVEEIANDDTIAPEAFKVSRTRDESIFDNKWFVVFSTQDKGVGVDHFVVCEFSKKNCEEATSPHKLKYQNPFYYIVVNAYDLNNNVQESLLVSPWLVLLIVAIILCIFGLILRFYRRYF